MGKKVSRGSEQFVLRLPDGMRDRLKNLAAENGRSVNAEIIARLEDYETLETRFAELAKRAAHNEGRTSGHLEAVKLMASILADARESTEKRSCLWSRRQFGALLMWLRLGKPYPLNSLSVPSEFHNKGGRGLGRSDLGEKTGAIDGDGPLGLMTQYLWPASGAYFRAGFHFPGGHQSARWRQARRTAIARILQELQS